MAHLYAMLETSNEQEKDHALQNGPHLGSIPALLSCGCATVGKLLKSLIHPLAKDYNKCSPAFLWRSRPTVSMKHHQLLSAGRTQIYTMWTATLLGYYVGSITRTISSQNIIRRCEMTVGLARTGRVTGAVTVARERPHGFLISPQQHPLMGEF